MDLMSVFKWVASLPSVNGDFLDSDVFVDVSEQLTAIQRIYHSTTIAARPLLADGLLTLGDRSIIAGGWTIERVSDADYSGVQFKRGEVVYELEATEVNHLYHLLLT